MANEEHLKILNQGVEQWNKWRLENAIKSGEVLAHERGASRSFSLLYPRGVVQTPAVKELVAFLVAEARRADVR